MQWDFNGDYLQQFPKNFTGTIGDRFCRAVRDGCDNPESVLKWIVRDLRHNDNPVWQAVCASCKKVDVGAWDFAQHILDRESLSQEEKQELKAASKASFGWKTEPPTEKQLSYLQALKCPVVPKTKSEASDLIGQFKASREPEHFKPKSTPF
jgi:hypothetical protein